MIKSLKSDEIYPLFYMEVPDYTKPYWNNQTYVWMGDLKLTDLRNDEYSASLAISNQGFNFVAFYSTQSVS